jgi:long-subunit acyl-CoA synthetase (AMP-forming)
VSNVLAALLVSARNHPERIAFQDRTGHVRLSWADVAAAVGCVAGGLAERGVRRGDTVALLIGNRPEFAVLDAAVAALGAIPVSLYLTASPSQARHVIADTGARVVICDAANRGLVKAVAGQFSEPPFDHVVVLDDPRETGPSWGGLDASDPIDLEAAAARVRPDDVLTIVYTSGTTGPPKGAEITHDNVAASVASMSAVIPRREQMRLISWLPSAHAAERLANYYTAMYFAATVTCCANVHEIGDCLREVRPTWFFGVPRVWEKLAEGLRAAWAGLAPDQQQRVADAVAAGTEAVELRQAGEEVPAELAAAVDAAEGVFALSRAGIGLDDVDAVNVGSAPCPREVITFFHVIGVPLSELWGMTETTAGGTVNPADDIRIGTAGRAAPGTEVRIAPDGEVLVRGRSVIRRYRNLPDATAAAIDADGWLHTGDLGTLDDDGYLRIVGRKKELIVNSYGKNMSPALIEGALTASSSLIGHAVAVGDRRPYNTALIVLDGDAAATFAAEHGLPSSITELVEEPAVTETVRSAVARANTGLSGVERIRRFHMLAEDWVPGGDQLTPTMKLRRAVVMSQYDSVVDSLYDGAIGVEV